MGYAKPRRRSNDGVSGSHISAGPYIRPSLYSSVMKSYDPYAEKAKKAAEMAKANDNYVYSNAMVLEAKRLHQHERLGLVQIHQRLEQLFDNVPGPGTIYQWVNDMSRRSIKVKADTQPYVRPGGPKPAAVAVADPLPLPIPPQPQLQPPTGPQAEPQNYTLVYQALAQGKQIEACVRGEWSLMPYRGVLGMIISNHPASNFRLYVPRLTVAMKLPMPCKSPLSVGQDYYMPNFGAGIITVGTEVQRATWHETGDDPASLDFARLHANLVYATEAEAQEAFDAYTEAMRQAE